MTTLLEYVAHAEKFGADEIYETAEEVLTPESLGKLAKFLRSLPAGRYGEKWKLSPEQRDRLVHRLLDAGVDDVRIMAWADISKATLKRLKGSDSANQG